jgi:hypothetical protein
MSDRKVPEGWLDYETFDANRRRFPPEELLKYAGQNIAWTWDGTRILASGKDLADLEKKLEALGIDASKVVVDYIDPPDVSILT